MSATPEQLHEMLTYCIDFSRTMLEKAGEFYPFGATLNANGQVGAQGGWNGEEHPNPREIYKLLADAFASMATSGEITGAALAANVDVPVEYVAPTRDALRVHLEADGYSRFIYVPYKLQMRGVLRKKREVEFFEPIPVEISSTFFRDRPDV
jgi:hypothetical protein